MKKKTTTKRRSTRPGASKAPAKKRKSAVSGVMPGTIQVSGVGTYKKSTCHKTKTDAKKAAESRRSKGGLARVRKNPKGGYCVYARGRG
jgi:hypothetical protein